jgi:hypothetical protein
MGSVVDWREDIRWFVTGTCVARPLNSARTDWRVRTPFHCQSLVMTLMTLILHYAHLPSGWSNIHGRQTRLRFNNEHCRQLTRICRPTVEENTTVWIGRYFASVTSSAWIIRLCFTSYFSVSQPTCIVWMTMLMRKLRRRNPHRLLLPLLMWWWSTVWRICRSNVHRRSVCWSSMIVELSWHGARSLVATVGRRTPGFQV